MRDAAAATPVTIITGFLGSGKTTLLNGLLSHPDIGETAVLINEFGDIGVDHLLVRAVSEGVVLLGSGCICCTVQGELVTTLRDLFIKRARQDIPDFRRVLIETTGLADASAIDALQARLAGLNPSAPRRAVAFGAVTPDDLFDAGLFDSRIRRLQPGPWLNGDAYDDGGNGHGGHAHAPVVTDGVTRHDEHIASFSLAFDQAVEWMPFRRWLEGLLRDNGDRLLRIKGIINIDGKDGPFVVHCVKHIQHEPTILPAWPDDDHRSRLVFITRDFGRAAIEDALREHLDGAN